MSMLLLSYPLPLFYSATHDFVPLALFIIPAYPFFPVKQVSPSTISHIAGRATFTINHRCWAHYGIYTRAHIYISSIYHSWFIIKYYICARTHARSHSRVCSLFLAMLSTSCLILCILHSLIPPSLFSHHIYAYIHISCPMLIFESSHAGLLVGGAAVPHRATLQLFNSICSCALPAYTSFSLACRGQLYRCA